jgi:hypothetical protein
MARTKNGLLTGAAAHRNGDELDPGPSRLTERERLVITRDVVAGSLAQVRRDPHYPAAPDVVARWVAELEEVQARIDNLPDPLVYSWLDFNALPTPSTPCKLADDLRASLLP